MALTGKLSLVSFFCRAQRRFKYELTNLHVWLQDHRRRSVIDDFQLKIPFKSSVNCRRRYVNSDTPTSQRTLAFHPRGNSRIRWQLETFFSPSKKQPIWFQIVFRRKGNFLAYCFEYLVEIEACGSGINIDAMANFLVEYIGIWRQLKIQGSRTIGFNGWFGVNFDLTLRDSYSNLAVSEYHNYATCSFGTQTRQAPDIDSRGSSTKNSFGRIWTGFPTSIIPLVSNANL